jgi:peroxiredoxin
MKLSINQHAPDFNTHDVYGNKVDLKKLQGKKVYLAFERNAGCPVCNLHTHHLLRESQYFADHNIKVLLIYESPVAKMIEYLGENTYPFSFISDPQNTLYNNYGVERSVLKVMAGIFHGLMDKVSQGTKLFKKPMKQDGHLNRIPAEFIIAENGKVILAHYGRFVSDHLSIEVLKDAAHKNSYCN